MTVNFINGFASLILGGGLPLGALVEPPSVSAWHAVAPVLPVITQLPAFAGWLQRARARFGARVPYISPHATPVSPSFSIIQTREDGKAISVTIPTAGVKDPLEFITAVTNELLLLRNSKPVELRFHLPEGIDRAVLVWGKWMISAYRTYTDRVIEFDNILKTGKKLSDGQKEALAEMREALRPWPRDETMARFGVWAWAGENGGSEALATIAKDYFIGGYGGFIAMLDIAMRILLEGRPLMPEVAEKLKIMLRPSIGDSLRVSAMLSKGVLLRAGINPGGFEIANEENCERVLFGGDEIELPFIDSMTAVIQWIASRCHRAKDQAEPRIKITFGALRASNFPERGQALPILVTAEGLVVNHAPGNMQAIADAVAIGRHDHELEDAGLLAWKSKITPGQPPGFVFEFSLSKLVWPGREFSLV